MGGRFTQGWNAFGLHALGNVLVYSHRFTRIKVFGIDTAIYWDCTLSDAGGRYTIAGIVVPRGFSSVSCLDIEGVVP